MVILAQTLLTGAAVVMSAWAGTPWPGTAGLALVCAVAVAATAPLGARRERTRTWAAAAAWGCSGILLAIVLVSSGTRATLGSYVDSYYAALSWIIAAAILPPSYYLPADRARGPWRLLTVAWAALGALLWVGAAYVHNRSWAFFAGLLILLALLVLCHFWFRLRAPAILAVNTFILLLLGLPIADLLARGVDLLHRKPDPHRHYYLYAVAKENPAASARWWNYYITQWREVERRIYAPDPDPVLLKRLRPNSRAQLVQSPIVINSRGFRGREIPAEKGDAYRIVALGASTTFGVTLNREDRPWPERLEQLIRKRLHPPRPVQVVNAGVPGYRLDQNLYRFPTEILPLKPDLVLSYHGINNFGCLQDTIPISAGPAPPAYKERPIRLLADAEYHLKLMHYQHSQPPTCTPNRATLRDPLDSPYARLYRQLIQITQTNHIRLALANFSMAVNEQSGTAVVEFYQSGYPLAPWQLQANRVHSIIVQKLAEQHPELCFVDTHPHLDGEHDKFIDLVHFAPAGDEQMAETFFTALRPILEHDLLRP
jgi:lysophospholipase L1-like esterase